MATTKRTHRVLIVDDMQKIHDYAARAFRDFQRWNAYSPEEAKILITEEQTRYDARRPFDLLSSDINMPNFPNGLELMRWFHESFPDIPIICHSDDNANATKVPFAKFVEKTYVNDTTFNVDEALLRAAALNALFGKQDFGELVRQAQISGARDTIEDLGLPSPLRCYVKALRETLRSLAALMRHSKLPIREEMMLSDVLALARSGYVDDRAIVEIIRYVRPAFV